MFLLDKVHTAMARETDLPELLRVVVESVADTFAYSQVSLYLLEGDSLALQHQVGYERVIERIPLTAGMTERTIRTGQPVFVKDTRASS